MKTHKEEMQDEKVCKQRKTLDSYRVRILKAMEYYGSAYDHEDIISILKELEQHIIKTTGEKILAERPDCTDCFTKTESIMCENSVGEYDEVVKKITGV